jgi:hypothetical protein
MQNSPETYLSTSNIGCIGQLHPLPAWLESLSEKSAHREE